MQFACLGALSLLWGGCELFPDSTGSFATAERKLPALKPPPDAIQLEIVFVERPVGDRLLGEQLWRDVDQILNLEPQAQRDLTKNGFQIGVVGTHPPPPLQTMLGLKSDLAANDAAIDDKQLSGNRIFIRSGMTTEVLVAPTYPACDLTLHSSRPGAPNPDTRNYAFANCMYRVTAHRVQEGWVRLDFVPEIRYGDEKLRPAAGANAWEWVSAQKADRLFDQQFSVMLNVGEMAIVTGRSELPGTAGYRFFIGPEGSDEIQRLLLIRLAHVEKAAEKL